MPTPITASTLSALLSAALAQKPTRPLVLALDGRCGSAATVSRKGSMRLRTPNTMALPAKESISTARAAHMS